MNGIIHLEVGLNYPKEMIRLFYKIIKSVLHCFRAIRTNRYYDSLLKRNRIKNHNKVKEIEWINKWAGFKTKPHLNSYRLFSHYIGHNVNIVPETICNSIEAYLNPAIYRPYYSDKNIYDKIFPEGYLPKTILRKCWGGCMMLIIN